MVVLEVTERGRHRMVGNLWFLDDAGACLAAITGYECTADPSLAAAFHADAALAADG